MKKKKLQQSTKKINRIIKATVPIQYYTVNNKNLLNHEKSVETAFLCLIDTESTHFFKLKKKSIRVNNTKKNVPLKKSLEI